jgi:TolA-binding protein
MLLLGNGCSHITVLRTRELREVQARVDSLRVEIESDITENQKKQGELLRVIRADMQVKFGELGQRVSALEQSISESQYRLSKIDEKTQEIRERWEERARADSLVQSEQDAEIEKLFQIAYGDFTAGRYDLALGGFEDLLNRFPEASKTQEAAYWAAECHYVKNDLAAAEEGYKGYIKNYPQGGKLCASLYKLGLIYRKQNKSKSQKLVWEKLLAQCPDSEEAQAATSRMP